MVAKSTGRPPEGLTIVDVVAGVFAVCLANGSPNDTQVASALHSKMPAAMRKARGITREWPTATIKGKARKRMVHRAQEAVRRRFLSLLGAVDAYRGLRHENLELDELITIASKHIAEDPSGEGDQAVLHLLLSTMNDLIHNSLDFVPRPILGQLGRTVAVDGTFLPTYARSGLNHKPYRKVVEQIRSGQPVDASDLSDEERTLIARQLGNGKASKISADPEAGHYIRKDQNGIEYKGFGFEGHVLVGRDEASEREAVRCPTLVLGLAVDAPGFAPGANAINVLRQYKRWSDPLELSPRIGVFDALYPTLRSDNFQLPLREMGLGLVGRIRDGELGKSGVQFEGYNLVEGTWCCASMPSRLVDASKDRVRGAISEAEYQTRLEQRRKYEAYRTSGSDLLDPDGGVRDHRFMCPAQRPTNPMQCVNKPGSPAHLPLLPIAEYSGSKPKACLNKTLRIPHLLGVRHEQAFPYMSAQWREHNDRFRSSNEGIFGRLKNPAGLAVSTKGRRRVRGLAANGLIVAIQFAAGNLQAMKTFLQKAEPDTSGVLVREYSDYRRKRQAAKEAGSERPSRRTASRTTLRKRPNPVRASSARAPVQQRS